ncbi:hypothetical protein PLEIONE_68 [Mycobacterium phage Pleione]|uniref:Uncharacterized protein n=2 Tax=Bixzunavirus Bxz1 TaxID=2006134 RepID=Q19XJ8_9CAUD|nr:hypothetical protein PLEIONE_68 [Mycobacterium phage Pleione]YP_656077.1 gp64 [Mycobacterium phage Catera]ABE67817.1 hypothetical protein PBI_CATERA_64 [Mycobacterium phage Catera]AEN79692.1 hypothetical protein PLEIONE_68 [Mycobacterium phage Pleione]
MGTSPREAGDGCEATPERRDVEGEIRRERR